MQKPNLVSLSFYQINPSREKIEGVISNNNNNNRLLLRNY
jgi:hypothetical protein